MPTLDANLLLDLLFAAIVLLFVPFGIRRGVAKEAMVSAAILVGVAIADAWTNRGAETVGDRTNSGIDTARFVVAAGALVLSTVILGYGGGAALGRVRPGLLSRLTGGLLAAFNGALFLSSLLRLIERHLWREEGAGVVDDGLLGQYLLRDDEWIVLAAVAVMSICVVLGWVVTGFRGRNAPLGDGPLQTAGPMPPRQRPVRVARDGDAGKVEPVVLEPTVYSPVPEPRPGRFGGGSGSLGQTVPIADQPDPWRSPDASDERTAWSPPRMMREQPTKTNGHASSPTVAGDWLRRATGMRRGGEAAPGSNAGQRDESGGGARPRTGLSCPVCGAAVGEEGVFCPECGATV